MTSTRTRAQLSVFVAFFVLLAASNLATPLYAVYRGDFGFGTSVLTLIFATYAIVLVASLLLFGQLSDALGRRLVIAIGMAVGTIALVVFAAADAEWTLFLARALQGVAVGMVSGSAAAALVELDSDGRAALLATLAAAGGSAAGPALAGPLAQWAPDRLVTPFVVGIALTTLSTVAMLATVPSDSRPGVKWTVVRPRVPGEIAAPFARAAAAAALTWAVAALFLSVVPSYASELLDSSNLALLGLTAATMLASSCVVQVLVRDRLPALALTVGSLLVVAGLAALVLAFPAHSLPLLLAAGFLGGAGHGYAFLGAQSDVNALVPDERRGELSSAFFCCIYSAVAVSVIGVGVLGERVALSTAVDVFAAVIGAGLVAVAVWGLRRGAPSDVAPAGRGRS